MGKMIIIVIVGLTIIVGIISVSMVSRTTNVSKSSSASFKKTYARNIASSAAEYYIRQVKAAPGLRGTFPVSSILSGTASVQLQDWTVGVADIVKLTSIGTYNATQETVIVKLMQGSTLPMVNSAINFHCSNPTFSSSGTLSFDGRDHDLNNNLLAPSANDRSGVSVMIAVDTSIFVPAHAGEINGTQDVLVDVAIPDPDTFVPNLIAKADYVLTGSYSSPQTWGSVSSPVIVYCSGSVKFSQVCDGWGILICEKLESTNKFTWRGLVICNVNADWKTSNTMKVIGGLLFGSTGSSKYNSSGVANIHYSKAGLALAQQAAGSGGGGLTVENWFE